MKKKCSKCGEYKTLDMFYNSNSAKTGKTSACKKCILNKVKSRQEPTKDEYKRRLIIATKKYLELQKAYNESLNALEKSEKEKLYYKQSYEVFIKEDNIKKTLKNK